MPKDIHMSLFVANTKMFSQLSACTNSWFSTIWDSLSSSIFMLKWLLPPKYPPKHLPFPGFPASLDMDPITTLFILSSLLILSIHSPVEAAKVNPQITVMGIVYCDTCSNNTFSRHSYFLPGVEVRLDCIFKAHSRITTEQVSFSVNRTTDKHGIYRLRVPSVDGIQCARDKAMESSCRASLIASSSSSCNVPGYTTTTNEIEVKSRRANLCIYSLSALSYRPSQIDITLCQN